jgi:hypothetical protein
LGYPQTPEYRGNAARTTGRAAEPIGPPASVVIESSLFAVKSEGVVIRPLSVVSSKLIEAAQSREWSERRQLIRLLSAGWLGFRVFVSGLSSG